MRKLFICAAALLVSLSVFAETTDELKAQRVEMKAKFTSKEAVKKATNIAKKVDTMVPVGGSIEDVVKSMVEPLPEGLRESASKPLLNLMKDQKPRTVTPPAAVGLATLDGLVGAFSPLLILSVSLDDVLAEYKEDIIKSEDGEIDLSKYQGKAKDYLAVLPVIANASASAAKGAEQLANIMGDISKLNPLQAVPAVKASKWIGEAVDVTIYKLAEVKSLLTNLTKSLSAAK